MQGDPRAAAERAARESYGKLVAFLAARSRDIAAAEDALAEAFATALVQWPRDGVPDRPDAWLLTVARRRMADAIRRRATADAATEHLTMIDAERREGAPETIADERLRLMFACAHPAIDPAARAPLILQTILGLDAASIAAAFLVPPATMSQRLVRAKTRIRDAGIPFRVPEQEELPERLDAVLAAIYAAFGAGWSDADGSEPAKRDLATEAIWLGRVVTAQMPGEAEPAGLLALMLYVEARRSARRDGGRYVPLSEQDPADWNGLLIDEAETLLARASALAGVGRFQIEAAIQSIHCARRATGATDWAAVLAAYDVLMALSDSPVAAINRAVALAEIDGPTAGLAELDRLASDRRIAGYQPYWAARAELAARMGNMADAAEAWTKAIELADDPTVCAWLKDRLATATARAN